VGSKFVCVVGVPGVGKTTICQNLARGNPNWHYLPTGEEKQKLLRFLGIRTPLRMLDNTASRLINELHFAQAKQQLDNSFEVALLDTHASYALDDGSFVSLLPRSTIPDFVLLVEAPVETVVARRIERGRSRDTVHAIWVEEELIRERAEVAAYSELTGVPYTFISSDDCIVSNVAKVANELNKKVRDSYVESKSSYQPFPAVYNLY